MIAYNMCAYWMVTLYGRYVSDKYLMYVQTKVHYVPYALYGLYCVLKMYIYCMWNMHVRRFIGIQTTGRCHKLKILFSP